MNELNLYHFKTDRVENMILMFHECTSLKELNISNFVFNNSNNVEYMFSHCPNELKNRIIEQYKNTIKEDAFYDFDKIEFDDFIIYNNNDYDYDYAPSQIFKSIKLV